MDHVTNLGGMKISLTPTIKKNLTGDETYLYGYYVFTGDGVRTILDQIRKTCPKDDIVYTVFINGRAVISFINKDERLTIKNGEFEYAD